MDKTETRYSVYLWYI